MVVVMKRDVIDGRKDEERVRDFGLMVEIDGEVKELRSFEEEEVVARDEIAIDAEKNLVFFGEFGRNFEESVRFCEKGEEAKKKKIVRRR
ncbi:unnamed protein product [Arabidopsis lyrata]|uniref:Predicted protein n=1 Tax=Arabidopsis lyrata subsp. lyrata TaxID=81972 RepID=D7M3W6_ARALL|nr:predicted protein [Arabidopsis lyrata subsp. lyrata]CAH8272197.1 unnamed protein product [Arabidopsis lyrata]